MSQDTSTNADSALPTPAVVDRATASGPWVALGALGAASWMLWWSWGRCPDLLTDYGREVYIPWQLAQGKTLYVDIAHFNGPLSQYFNSLVFRLFGTGIGTLTLANSATFAVLLWLDYRLILAIGNRVAAAAAVAMLVLVFGFGHYSDNGNYNYLYPYSHEAPHGVILALAAVYCLWRATDSPGHRWTAASGLLLGLTALTKVEMVVAATAALGLGLAGACALRTSAADRRSMVATFIVAALVPPLVAWLLLSLAMPAAVALRGTLGGLKYLFDEQVLSQQFYRNLRGTTRLAENLSAMGIALGAYVALGGLALVAASRSTQRVAGRFALAAVVLAIVAGVSLTFRVQVFRSFLLPLPLVLGGVLAGCAWKLRVAGSDRLSQRRLVLTAMLAMLGLALSLKILLTVGVEFYGFVLAMPGTLVLLALLLAWIPAAIERRGGSGLVFQAAILGALGVLFWTALERDAELFAQKTMALGTGGDRIWAYPAAGEAFSEMLGQLAVHVRPGDTLLAIPEGALLNYYSGHVNSTPYLNFFPPDVIMFGEEAMVAALAAAPPDYLVLAPSNAFVYGYRGFGDGYATRLATWVVENYERVDAPPSDGRFHLSLLRRVKPGSATPPR